jgi:hypothetical protein
MGTPFMQCRHSHRPLAEVGSPASKSTTCLLRLQMSQMCWEAITGAQI